MHHYSKRTHCKNGHEFTEENTLRRGNGRVCRACKREHQQENKSAYAMSQKERSNRTQIWINNYLKEHPCVDCGETDPTVLQFDHVVGKKMRDVTGLTLLSIESILKEIAKCEVVCANDHVRRTARRANTIRWQLNN